MSAPEYPHKVTQAAMVGCRGCSCVGYVCEYHDAFNDGVEALRAAIAPPPPPIHCWLCDGDGRCQPHNDYCQDHESGNPICGPDDPCHVCDGTGRYVDLSNGGNR